MIGTRLGCFELTDKLGAGGMGEVYRARDTNLNRTVAVKVLPASGDQSLRRRFLREARIVSGLSHPNIVTVYDFGEQDSHLYLVTELVAGDTLRTVMKRGPMPMRRVLDIATQIADGLSAAHQAPIAHRDLKPENIMLTPEGRVKILDFGLAKRTAGEVDPDAEEGATVSDLSTPGMVMGTVNYMSPEQARGGPIDIRTDQFSFGILLYELLANRQPFRRETNPQTMAAIIAEEVQPLDSAVVPTPLRWVLDRCLEKEPARRYGSTVDLFRDLARIKDGLSELSRPPVTVEPVQPTVPLPQPPPPGRPWMAMAGVALVFLAAGFLLFPLLRPEPPDASRLRLMPFATQPERESSPRWSPDGKSIAYLAAVNGVQQVLLRSLDNPTPVTLTKSTSSLRQPFWSADGRDVYFRALGERFYDLWKVPVAGGEPVRLATDVSAADISPDGKTLAMLRGAKLEFVLASPDGTDLRPYRNSPLRSASWSAFDFLRFSPTGNSILVRAQGNWLAPYPESGSAPELGGGMPIFPEATWLRDGTGLIRPISSGGGKPRGLELLDSVSGRARLLMPTLVQDADGVDLSPDGKLLAVTLTRRDDDVLDVSLTGGEIRPLLATALSEKNANWVPSQNAIAYVTDRDGSWSIWLKDLAGRWERQVVKGLNGNVRHFGLTVSPDGARLAYLADRREVLVVPTSGGTPIVVHTASADENHHRPDWSPDGRWLVFDSLKGGQRKLVKLRVGANSPPEVIADGINPFTNRWSPDGNWIAAKINQKLTLVAQDGSQRRPLASAAPGACAAWSRDSRSVYLAQVAHGRYTISQVDAATGAERVVRDLGSDLVLNIDNCMNVSPDGKSVALTVTRMASDIWIAEGFLTRRSWWDRLLDRVPRGSLPVDSAEPPEP